MSYHEWIKRYVSVFGGMQPKEAAREDSILCELMAEYPDDPELAAWSRYLGELRHAHQLAKKKWDGQRVLRDLEKPLITIARAVAAA